MNVFLQDKKNRAVFVIGVVLYLSVLIFLVVSLVSYNFTDSSWVYVASDAVKPRNACGSVGANVAALLFYFFGCAGFVVFIPLLCGLYIYAWGLPLRKEWERLAASFYLIFVTAAWCSVNGGDGGLIGLLFSQKLLYYCDAIGRTIFINTSIGICLVLLSRWSFMWMVHYVIAAVLYCNAIMKRYHVVSKSARAVAIGVHAVCVRMPLFFIQFIRSLFDGDAFDDTGLIIPEELHDEYIHDEYISVREETINFVIASESSQKISAVKAAFNEKFPHDTIHYTSYKTFSRARIFRVMCQ